MIGCLRLELARTVRDVRYLALAVIAPVGFYLLFSSVFGGRSSGPNSTFGLPAAEEIMVAMATFGAMWAALTATAPRLAQDRAGGWLEFLATTPLAPRRLLAARILAGLVAALPAIVAVGIAAIVAHGVRLEAWQWVAGLGLLWIGTLPFVALGIAIGSLTTGSIPYALSSGAWFALAALGGLWVPPGQLSQSLRHLAEGLPSYNQAALGWHVVSGSAPSVTEALVLAAWTLGLALLPMVVRPRSRARAVAESGHSRTQAIELDGLAKQFAAVSAVDGIDLQIPTGQAVALLGPNGSGKTTTIAILLGLLHPDRGSARLFGSAPRQATRSGKVGVMLQDAELMSGVRVGELIHFVRGLYPSPAMSGALVEMAGLRDFLGKQTEHLSGGQAQRVRFALAAAGDPPLLVLDEPTAAMDIQGRQDLWAALHRHAQQRATTVLFSTHHLNEADEHADRVILIRSGRIIADGSPDQVKATAGAGRTVSFQLLHGNPDRFRAAPGVTAVHTSGDHVTLHTTDADSTIWGIYDQRDTIADIQITDASLEDAILNLISDPRTPTETPALTAQQDEDR